MNLENLRKVEVVTVTNQILIEAIMCRDTEYEENNFWGSEMQELITDELNANGRFRRHPVYTDFVVDVINADVYNTEKKTVKKLTVSKSGSYNTVYVRNDDNEKNAYLSRIVMEAFLGIELVPGMVVHHYCYVNGIKDSIYNLRYTTQKENSNIPHGEHLPKNIRYWYYVMRDGVCVYITDSLRDIAEFLGVTKASVQCHTGGRMKTVAGCTIRREVKS